MKKYFLLIVLCGLLQGVIAQKINGVNFVGTRQQVPARSFDPIVDLGADHVCFVPFAYGKFNEPTLTWQGLDWQWWGESKEGVRQSVRMAHSKGLRTIVKPQIWFDHGSFTGHFELKSDSDWKRWESDYRGYILSFAELCEEEGAEMFCIGTELCRFAEQRPQFWKELISEVRKVYSGKLTYASNWDSYQRFPHWNLLDYIGIDAYFPLCDQQTPKLKTLLNAWQMHYSPMEAFSHKIGKPVLFTEFGYRSTDYCAKEPWDSNRGGTANEEAQYNSYLALFQRFWTADWFAGGLLWKWYPTHEDAGGSSNTRFTPQNKMAQKLIQDWYLRY